MRRTCRALGWLDRAQPMVRRTDNLGAIVPLVVVIAAVGWPPSSHDGYLYDLVPARRSPVVSQSLPRDAVVPKSGRSARASSLVICGGPSMAKVQT